MEDENSKMKTSVFNQSGSEVMHEYRSAEEAWAHFCCCPDSVAPQKMPSLFPTPTHLVRRRITKTIDAHEYTKLIYSPEYLYGQGVIVGRANSWAPGHNNSLSITGMSVATGSFPDPGAYNIGDWGPQPTTTGGNKANYVYHPTDPLGVDVAEGGARLVAACISIEYLGKVDNIEGLVEIGMNVNSVNTCIATIPLADINFLSDTGVNQAPYYTRHRLSDGVRTIWFPMDESRFEFNETYKIIDYNRFEALFPGVWAGTELKTFVVPSSQTLTSTFHGTHFPGATHHPNSVSGNVFRLENNDMHSRARLEWAINFIGLTASCPVRIYINQFYETIPHEESQDDFFPQKSPQGNSDTSTKLMHSMSKEVAVTTKTGTSGWGFAKNVLSKIWDYASPFIAPLVAAGLKTKGYANASTALMYGAGFGGMGAKENSGGVSQLALPYRTRGG